MSKRKKSRAERFPSSDGYLSLVALAILTDESQWRVYEKPDPKLPLPERVSQAMRNAAAELDHFQSMAGFQVRYFDTDTKLERDWENSRKQMGKFAKYDSAAKAASVQVLGQNLEKWKTRLQVLAAQLELNDAWTGTGTLMFPLPRPGDDCSGWLDAATLHRIVKKRHPEIEENPGRWVRSKVKPVVDWQPEDPAAPNGETFRVNMRMLMDAFPSLIDEDRRALLQPRRLKNASRRSAKKRQSSATHTKRA